MNQYQANLVQFGSNGCSLHAGINRMECLGVAYIILWSKRIDRGNKALSHSYMCTVDNTLVIPFSADPNAGCRTD